MTDLATMPAALDLALLKAVGLDRAAPEQRQLAISIAERYGLDLMLKHLVLIEGRPYVTRDALLHIAHRSGQFDGISVTDPVLDGETWRASCSVYRKDMGHPFVYSGRYPAKGGNAKFAPEMAIKVAECMALRRAFDVAAPVFEERWDVEAPYEPPTPKVSLAEKAAAKVLELPPAEPIPPEVHEKYVNPEEIAEGAPAILRSTMTADRLARLCREAGKTKQEVAAAIGIVTTHEPPEPDKVSAAVRVMSDEYLGRVADELNLDWRGAA